MQVENLGETILTGRTDLWLHEHVNTLENRVDDLETENRLLKDRLSDKPSAVTQEAYDDLCRRYQMEVANNLPF